MPSAVTISERTRLPLSLVLTLFTMVAGGIATFAVTKNELGHVRDDVGALQRSDAAGMAERRDTDRRLQRLEDNSQLILEQLKEMKDDVKAIRRR
jgi:septal ring factor EnvC (AmiA/AmiB activator)